MSETFPVMTGRARMAMGSHDGFRVPLFSHVIDNLWQGCSPSEFGDTEDVEIGQLVYPRFTSDPVTCKWLTKDEAPRFDKIMNLYPWGEYQVPEGTERINLEAYDAEGQEYDTFHMATDQVIRWLDEGHKVLVHCQAGLNRSSLVVALVLMEKYKMPAEDAIDLIRKQRSDLCLCNDHFRQYLKGLK